MFTHDNIYSRGECDSQKVQHGNKESKDKDCAQQSIFCTQERTWTHSKKTSQRRDDHNQEGQGQSWLISFFIITVHYNKTTTLNINHQSIGCQENKWDTAAYWI